MYNRNIQLPLETNHSLFLLGPRGTGKTYWLKKMLQDAPYLDLLNFKLYQQLLAQPNRLSQYYPKGYTGWIIIDEVQRVPELLNEVHRLIEQDKKKFILTGSSARKLRKKGVNLLAGRALMYHMHPLTLQELGDDFDLSHALHQGLLPSTFDKPNAEEYLSAYIETYLREEVLEEGLTRNIGAFSRFLEVASYYSQGSIVNVSEIAREVCVSRDMISNYFSILEDLLIGHMLPVFSKRAKRRLISRSKFYYFDVGVYRHIRPQGPLDISSEIDGTALETLFFQSLMAVNDYNKCQHRFYYWQTATGLEVDFVAYGPRGLIAFEIKRANHTHSQHLRGLKAFKADYPEARCYLINFSSRREYHNDIEVIPYEDALASLPILL